MADHSHLSIGEVLSLLHDEFPDVTISKIRFLESQGLVDPERTPSGYRKFYDQDIERLRWVLRQQRDAFLPLKVIKGRLDEKVASPARAVRAGAPEGSEGQPRRRGGRARAGTTDSENTSGLERGGERTALGAPQLFDAGPPYSAYGVSGGNGSPTAPDEGDAAGSAPALTGPAIETARPPSSTSLPPSVDPSGPERGGPAGSAHQSGRRTAAEMRGARTGSGRPARDAIGSDAAAGVGRAAGFAGSRATRGYLRGEAGGPDDELALEELVLLTGVDLDTVRDLERFGLISPHMVAGAPFYSQEAGTIARLAHAFARHGVEARHLRAYKGAAEREAGMVQQVIMPLLRQRNPEARLAAAETAEELARLGGELRSALLRAALDELR